VCLCTSWCDSCVFVCVCVLCVCVCALLESKDVGFAEKAAKHNRVTPHPQKRKPNNILTICLTQYNERERDRPAPSGVLKKSEK
jgi:hypothetical protein